MSAIDVSIELFDLELAFIGNPDMAIKLIDRLIDSKFAHSDKIREHLIQKLKETNQ
jgi:hypothetical protein